MVAAPDPGRQIRDVAGHDHGRAPKPRCTIGKQDPVPIGQNPIGDHQMVVSSAQALVGRAGSLDRLDLISRPFEHELKDFPACGLLLYEEDEAGAGSTHVSLEADRMAWAMRRSRPSNRPPGVASPGLSAT